MSRQVLLLLLITGLFVGGIGYCWIQQPPSNQELLANYAKVQDYANHAIAQQGLPWWTTSYLQGSSLAFLSIGALTNLALYLASLMAGPYLGTKLAALAFLFFCPFSMFAFIRRLCPESPWAAFSCGLAYLFAPSILLRLGHIEHVGNVLAFAMLPLAFRSVLVFLEDRNAISALLCAAANALMVLAYVKIAVLALPLVLGFALWVWVARAHFAMPSWQSCLICVGVFVLLGALPNLPSMRELGFAIQFELGPFKGWQKTYSQESAISWIDRDSVLSGAPPSRQSEVRTNSGYLGIVALACVAAVFCLRKRSSWLTKEGSIFRLFIALAFLAYWLGLGVNNALLGQLAFLSHSNNAWDPAIALSWALLVLQGIALYLVLPGSLPSRAWWAAGILAVFFIVPGFRLIERLPLYGGLRAPHDFFEMGGVFCFSVAAGIAAYLLLKEIAWAKVRIAAAIILVLLASADATAIIPSFFKAPMEKSTFDDFLSAQKFLKSDPAKGSVFPFSGRYFYLLTPIFSGRGIATEAFNSHQMLRGVAQLQNAAFQSKQTLEIFFKIGGIAFILVDKKDPDTPQDLQDSLRAKAAVAFENDHFLILRNPGVLSPAAFAKSFAVTDKLDQENAGNVLAAAARGVVTIVDRTSFGDNQGKVSPDEPVFTSFAEIPVKDFLRANASSLSITPPAATGWIFLPEGFHPDWRAAQNGAPVEIAKAFGAFIGLRTTGATAPILLTFVPPAWYSLCIFLPLATWMALIILLIAFRLSLLPVSVRSLLKQTPLAGGSLVVSTLPSAPSSISRVLLIIPTYNEVRGIVVVLDKALQSHPTLEILVVDDASPDGTQDKIRSHSQFGDRIHLLGRSGKLGLGSAYKEGFDWALERGFDACMEMDADLSHDPADIPRLIEALENGADVAIGSRYRDGVRVLNWPQDRLFLSLGASKFVRTLTGLPLTDATSGFKAVRGNSLRALDWKRFKAEGYGFQVELHYFLWKSGAHIVEVPIVFTERREGNTKMNTAIAFEAFTRVVSLGLLGK